MSAHVYEYACVNIYTPPFSLSHTHTQTQLCVYQYILLLYRTLWTLWRFSECKPSGTGSEIDWLSAIGNLSGVRVMETKKQIKTL